MSERKAQLIYNAVHEEMMRLRVSLCDKPLTGPALDGAIAAAADRAGLAAAKAYDTRLLRKRGSHG